MNHTHPVSRRPDKLRKAFSLVELLVTIVILSVLASMVVTAVSNASVDSSRVVARQQQASVQQALSAWVLAESSTPGKSLTSVRSELTSAGNNKERFDLIATYLDPETRAEFDENTTNTARLQSKALARAGQYLYITVQDGYPTVAMGTDEN